MDKEIKETNSNINHELKDLKIDHSKLILHTTQTGMQCWSRSSQMILSYILRKMGFSMKEIKTVFYNNLFLDLDGKISQVEYKNLNQLILGRRLREKEDILTNLDDLVVKIYDEFGSTSFLAEVFPSFIKQYIQAFTRVTQKFQNKTLTLIMDNDNELETYEIDGSCKVIYQTFTSKFNNGIKTGLLKGEDKEFWESLDKTNKIKKLTGLLKISPILVESPGHAFVLSGYLPEEEKFIINDSMASETRVMSVKNLLKSLSSLVLLAEIK